MIDRWRHFCYNVNLILSPKKGGASTNEYLGECTLMQRPCDITASEGDVHGRDESDTLDDVLRFSTTSRIKFNVYVY